MSYATEVTTAEADQETASHYKRLIGADRAAEAVSVSQILRVKSKWFSTFPGMM